MELKELCDLLEIKSDNKRAIEIELVNKMGPIIMRYNADWPTSSFLAKRGGRSERELKYLKQKGLVYFHAKRDIGPLYKLTKKGVEAYNVYNNNFR